MTQNLGDEVKYYFLIVIYLNFQSQKLINFVPNRLEYNCHKDVLPTSKFVTDADAQTAGITCLSVLLAEGFCEVRWLIDADMFLLDAGHFALFFDIPELHVFSESREVCRSTELRVRESGPSEPAEVVGTGGNKQT